jgi:WD40 repeat protein
MSARANADFRSAAAGRQDSRMVTRSFSRYVWLALVVPPVLLSASRQPTGPEPLRLYVEAGIHHSARSVAFSGDGSLIAAGSLDRTIKIWDVRSSRELLTLPNEKMSTFLAFVPSRPILASSNEDGT